LGTAP